MREKGKLRKDVSTLSTSISSIVYCLLFQLKIHNDICKTFPTKMCIKFAPYLHKKSRNLALNMVCFFGVLVLMLLTKFDANSTNQEVQFRHKFNTSAEIGAYKVIKLETRFTTKMHKCLVGYI